MDVGRMLAGNATDPPNLNATITREVRWGKGARSPFRFPLPCSPWAVVFPCREGSLVPLTLALSCSGPLLVASGRGQEGVKDLCF